MRNTRGDFLWRRRATRVPACTSSGLSGRVSRPNGDGKGSDEGARSERARPGGFHKWTTQGRERLTGKPGDDRAPAAGRHSAASGKAHDGEGESDGLDLAQPRVDRREVAPRWSFAL